MKIKKLFYEKMNLTHEEIESFGVVENVLQSLYEAYGEGMLLTDLTSGVCIGISELPRVRGILSFIASTDKYEIDIE